MAAAVSIGLSNRVSTNVGRDRLAAGASPLLTHSTILKSALSVVVAASSVVLLSACGGDSALSASAVAKCVPAQRQSYSTLPANAQGRVLAKVVKGGWLAQSTAEEDAAEKDADSPGFELYVFKDDKTAEEAFNIMVDVKETWDALGAFRRRNMVITTDVGHPTVVNSLAESLLNRCAGEVPVQAFLRPKPTEIP